EPPRMSHSKSTCSALFLDRCLAAMAFVAIQLFEQIGQFNRHFGSFSALVSAFPAGTVHRLLHIVGRQHAKSYGHAGLQTHLVQSIRYAAGNELEMRSVAADNCA